MNSISEIVHATLFDGRKRVEPEQRWVGGSFGWAFHRFPIKGGISPLEVIARNVSANNALFKRLQKGA